MLFDPIADMLTQLRNAYQVSKAEVRLPYSRQKEEILKLILAAGYLNEVKIEGKQPAEKQLVIKLKYEGKQPAITKIKRVSKPSRRIYVGYQQIPTVLSGYGTVILSTPKGLMLGQQAKKAQVGGEIICEVS